MKYLTILIHGLEGSSKDWEEINGFSKGGNLTQSLKARGLDYRAYDLYGHGEWDAEEEDFDPSSISDDLYPKFVYRSADKIAQNIRAELGRGEYDGINLVSYSGGSVPGMKILKKLTNLRIGHIILCVPTPEKEYDDEFSLHNNLDVFDGRDVIVFMGTEDEEVPPEDMDFFFKQLHCRNKTLYRYPCGHALPVNWTKTAAEILEFD